MTHGKILAIDDEKNIRRLISEEFALEGFEVVTAGSGEEGLRLFDQSRFDLVLLDLKLPDVNGIETLKRIRQRASTAEVVMITGHGDIRSAVESIKLGARDYVTKPFKLDELLSLVRQTIADHDANGSAAVSGGAAPGDEARFIRCPSPAMTKVYNVVRRVAPTDNTVLIQGETGVGKDVMAMQLHLESRRADGPFISLDCGMLNHNLAESELYGHRKGSFSGASEPKEGLVEQSHTGSLFLDEIGNIDLDLQKKFLRFLETRRFRRVGEVKETAVDSRFILATNVDLHDAVEKGRLRADLLYRMDVISITIPPLRDREEDIPPLAAKMLERYVTPGRKIEISPEAMERLRAYPWPGNIRELKSVIAKAILFSDSDTITPQDLPSYLATAKKTVPAPAKIKSLAEMEKDHIITILKETGGNQSRAAEILGINRKTLYKKIQKYGID